MIKLLYIIILSEKGSNGVIMKNTLINTACGREKGDFVIKHGRVADLFTGRVILADVLVKDGYIAGVGDYDCENEIDAYGKYILPGFIDSHVHIESSMVTPPQYAKAVVPHGVTTVIADPHEITNVCGRDGLEFMKEASKGIPLDIKYMLPSCVPAAPFEHSGAVLTSKDTQELAKDFHGIGEMMNYPGIISADEETLGKLAGKYIDGHAPGLSGSKLDAYVAAGIKTDHECVNLPEMFEKIGKGMYIAIREGTLSKELARLIYGVNHFTFDRCTFCTDDRFIGEIISEGTIDYMIRQAVALSIPPLMAISVASFSAAQCYGLHDRGAIAPGYKADIAIADSVQNMNIEMVFKDGIKVAENGKALFDVPVCDTSKVTDTVHLNSVTAEFFAHEPEDEFDAVKLTPHSIITEKVRAHKGDKLSKVCVIERHHNTGSKGIGYVVNYGIENGAIACSIGHDSHNVIVIGDNDNDMALAVNTLGKSGGIAVASRGDVKGYLELEIAGLMTNRTAEEVTKIHDKLLEEARKLHVTDEVDPLLSLAFLPLPVIPSIRITDSGLFDVDSFEFI